MKTYTFEVCTNSVESCIAAEKGGAHRVELCAGIPEGGTTPSYGEIKMAQKHLKKTKLHVIIRPRGGDFLYTPLEIETMIKDIELCQELKVDGVVFGCLNSDGSINTIAMKQLMDAAQGLSVTFHRAFDVCNNPRKALDQIINLGCERILTSGQEVNAELGIPLLKELQKLSIGRIKLLAGCGVNESNIKKIAQETGITEFHFSAREVIPSQMTFRKERVPMGGAINIDEFSRPITTAKRVKDTIARLSE
ncbi:Copper homeostasis protein cutC [Bacteroides coprosuis DSM 18011]|uniref:PF03932 family protein CutC n=1 Tax=Bacteroides coprosuis DSM 18011 TaxID=679937 RepID=F3ZTG8_9BACE|nr:copper homeostasis protein CutC [Bacteroides coprosuis]EGJ71058.1 Copper homeostasis protein cutC [Bacteroides coprosuis DSM 18011]HJD92085.1 copper homeostasis protein CutC [Bacteroides coprosuis]